MIIQNPESLFSGFLTTQIIYFYFVLECDTCILESLFYHWKIVTHQIRPILKRLKALLQNEFYLIPDVSPKQRGPVLFVEKIQPKCRPSILSIYSMKNYKKRSTVRSNVLTFRYNDYRFLQIEFSEKTKEKLTMKISNTEASKENITIETFGHLIFHLNLAWTLLVSKLFEHQ